MRQRIATVVDELQFIVFRVGAREFALGILQVERILPFDPVTLRPGGRPPVLGLFPFGAELLPVVDLRPRLGPGEGDREETRLMVLELGGVRGAVVVDQVAQAIKVDARSIVPPPATGAPPYETGRFTRGDRTITVCHAGRFLDEAERLALRECLT
jgi:purine-binding chemotaxis protein CheW